MEDNKRYRTNYNNHNGKGKVKPNKFWSQKQNILPEGMFEKMTYQKRVMKDSIDLLNEELKKDRYKEKIYNIKKKNEFQRSSSSKIMEDVSPYAKTMLLKIGKHIKSIKQSITDITKMNGLYLEENAKKNYNQNRKRSIPKLKLRKNNSTDQIIQNPKTFNNNYDYISNKNGKSKKEDYIKNFVYVNDNYRKQLNFAFLKYNPISHLDNLKILIQADPSIRKDITKINEEIEEDIKWKCDKFHFRKKYLNLLSRLNRSRSVQQIQEKKNQTNYNNSKKLPNIKNKNYNGRKNKKYEKSISSIYTKVNLLEKLNKKEKQKLNQQKEQTQEEISHMLVATKEIDNLIQNDNINDKIDMFKTDYAKQMYYNTGSENISKNENLTEKDYFLDEKNKIVEKIGNVYSFQMNKNEKEKEKIFKGKINNENEKFRKKIIDGKKNTMEEFYSYIQNNQVNLPEQQTTI